MGWYYPEANFDLGIDEERDAQFTGSPVARVDSNIDFDWLRESPCPDANFPSDQFGVVWTGTLEPRFSEDYTVTVTHDDGVHLWINGELVVDVWGVADTTTSTSEPISLIAGERCDIRLEFYDNDRSADVSMFWSSPSQAQEIIPQTQLYSGLVYESDPLEAPLVSFTDENGDPVSPDVRDASGYLEINPSDRVVFTAVNAGESIRYTLDGTEPDASSKLYTGPLSFAQDTVIKACSFAPGSNSSGPTIERIRINNYGPALEDLQYGGDSVDTSVPYTITASDIFSVQASDDSGVERVEFYWDDGDGETLLATDREGVADDGALRYDAPLSVADWPDDDYELRIRAYDALGLVSEYLELDVTVAIAVPSAPVITEPDDGSSINAEHILLTGTAQPEISQSVSVFAGDANVGTHEPLYSGITVFEDGIWSVRVALPGDDTNISPHTFKAVAYNREGELSPASEVITLTRDTTFPPAPIGVSAQAQSGGNVLLSWRQGAYVGQIGHYLVYRSVDPITTTDETELLELYLATVSAGTLSYTDESLPDAESYYYRVRAQNTAGTLSDLSAEARVTADSVAPALSLTAAGGGLSYSFSPLNDGNYIDDTGDIPVYGLGTMMVDLVTDGELGATPTFYFVIDGGTSVKVTMLQVGTCHYRGTTSFSANTQNGMAVPRITLLDSAGNSQTYVLDGDEILDKRIAIETAAPVIDSLLEPVVMSRAYDPSSTDETVSDPEVRFTALFNRDVPEHVLASDGSQTVNEPSFILTRPDGANIVPDSMEYGLNAENNPDRSMWSVTFSLPEDVAEDGSEDLVLQATASNRFGSAAASTPDTGAYTVYRDPDAPSSLVADAGADRRVSLSWEAAAHTSGYQVWVKTGDGEYAVCASVDEATTSYVHEGLTEDGEYWYRVSSYIDGTESFQYSNEVMVLVDGTPPEAPEFVQVDEGDPELDTGLYAMPTGILARWAAPALGGDDIVSYRLYRSSSDVDGNLQLLSELEVGSSDADESEWLSDIDASPEPDSSWYAVTAVDGAGNESSLSAFLRLDVLETLPVTDVRLVLTDGENPTLSWAHISENVQEYAVDIIDPASGGLIRSVSLTDAEMSWVDSGYTGSERRYVITPIFVSGEEGPSRSINLPSVSVVLAQDQQVYTGLMNEVAFEVENAGDDVVAPGRIEAVFSDSSHGEAVYAADLTSPLLGGEVQEAVVVIPGLEILDPETSPESMTVSWLLEPEEGVEVKIMTEASVPVHLGTLPVEILSEGFSRGGKGYVRFKISNPSSSDIELVTATDGGRKASDEMTLALLSEDTLISEQRYHQQTGDSNYAAGTKRIQVIPAGASFTSDLVEFDVPETVGDAVDVTLSIGNVYYGLRSDDPVSLPLNLELTTAFSTVPLDYDAAILSVAANSESADDLDGATVAVAIQDEPVTITGQATLDDSLGGGIAAHVPVRLTIQKGQAEQVYYLTTDSEGKFEYTYETGGIAAGTYAVDASHPDYTSFRSDSGSFTVQDVYLGYANLNVSGPMNYTLTASLPVKVSSGTTLHNVRLRLPDLTAIPMEVSVDPADTMTELTASTTFHLEFIGTAAESSVVPLEFELVGTRTSDPSSEEIVWDTVEVNYAFDSTSAGLSAYMDNKLVTPVQPIQLGVYQSESASIEFVIKNEGYATARGVSLSLLNDDQSTSAPPWLSLLTPSYVEQIGSGESVRVVVAASPSDESLADTLRNAVLKVSTENGSEPLYVPLEVYVADPDNAPVCSATLHVINAYYGISSEGYEELVSDPNSASWAKWVYGVGGARVTLKREDSTADWFDAGTVSATTINDPDNPDSHGQVTFKNLTPGRYRMTVAASGHSSYSENIYIQPMGTGSGAYTFYEQVALSYEPVQVTWEVVSTTIEDKYEIVVETQFETQVPVPVIVVEPAYINLPNTERGEVYNGEYTISNNGLIGVEDVALNFYESDEYYRYELLEEVPDVVAAGQVVKIPFRITCLKSLDEDSEDESLAAYIYPGSPSLYGFLSAGIFSATSSSSSSCSYRNSSTVCYTYCCPWNISISWTSCKTVACGYSRSGCKASNPFTGGSGSGSGSSSSSGGGGGGRSSSGGIHMGGGGSSSPACKPDPDCTDPCCDVASSGGEAALSVLILAVLTRPSVVRQPAVGWI